MYSIGLTFIVILVFVMVYAVFKSR